MIGVYEIRSQQTGSHYVGSSVRLAYRKAMHRHRLKRRNHHSIALQDCYDAGHRLKFTILEKLSVSEYKKNPKKLRDIEQWYINRAFKEGKCLNTSPSAYSYDHAGRTNWRKGKVRFSLKEVEFIRKRIRSGSTFLKLSKKFKVSTASIKSAFHGIRQYVCYPVAKREDLRKNSKKVRNKPGTWRKGQIPPNKGKPSLSFKDVKEIRKRVEGGESLRVVAKDFDFCGETISQAFHGTKAYSIYPVKHPHNLRNDVERIRSKPGSYKKGQTSLRKGKTILSKTQVNNIRRRWKNGEYLKDMINEFKVSYGTLMSALHGEAAYKK